MLTFTIRFDSGQTVVYESIVDIDFSPAFETMCLCSEDGSYYHVKEDRILSWQVESECNEQTAVDIANLFD